MKKMKPILFNTEMVQAILEGRKTQTRRVIKPQPKEDLITDMLNKYTYAVGDILWVRETWNDLSNNEGNFVYLADGDKGLKDKFFGVLTTKDIKWKPSIHMPKASARIFLKVTDVRVERLQDITEEDARAEGVIPIYGNEFASEKRHYPAFARLWDSLNAKRGFGWDTNPWVWVIQFERVESNGS